MKSERSDEMRSEDSKSAADKDKSNGHDGHHRRGLLQDVGIAKTRI